MAHNQERLATPTSMLTFISVFALILGSLSFHQAPNVQAATTLTVTPNTPNGWVFDNDGSLDGGIGEFFVGPATPPLGTGSVHLQLYNTTSSRKIIFNPNFTGTRLDTLTKLQYSSYRSFPSTASVQAVSLQFDMDFDLSDSTALFQGRLVYEPYLSGTSVDANSWQNWDALAGKWWASRAPFNNAKTAVPPGCPMGDPCTWAEVLQRWPNAGINNYPYGVIFKAGGPAAGFDGNIDAFTIGIATNETTYDFEYAAELACTADCYVNTYFGNDSYGGASPERAKKTIQAALDQVSANGTVHVAAGNYAEAVSITKNGVTLIGAGAGTNPLQHTILKGPIAANAGILLPNGNTTSVSIKNLRVEGFSNGGICSLGSNNNNLSIDSIQVVANTAGSCLGGIYINGPVSDVSINNVLAEQNISRGIVLWNGFKQRISITNNTVTQNNCCGIELQDGTASGVTITGNTITNNMDNGIAVIGLMAGAGPNLIANNTLSNNGRFGIEVKLPNGTGAESGDGSIVVRDNSVQLLDPIETLRPAEERDLGGIVVIRRGYVVGNNNVDIPTGVVIKNNTISGYKQNNLNSTSEGFGIVVEGYNMSVYGNTISKNDIGIQRQAGHLPYTANAAIDGDQSDLADSYFGRGNAPHTCAVIGTNTFSMNGIDIRNITPACDVVAGLQFSTQPGSAQVNSPLNPQPIVTVLGQDGQVFSSYTGQVTLALANNPDNATLAGTLTVNAINGVATFTGLSLNKTGTGYTLVASSDGLAAVTSAAFDITAGPATQLSFSTQPGSTQLGNPLNPQPVVTVLDAQGNVANSYTGSITLAFGNNPSSATLNGSLTMNAVNGIATFSGVSVSKAGTNYTLVASANGLTSATSASFTITSSTATQLSFSKQPGSASAGSPLKPQPVVRVLDAQGNLVTSYTGTISIAIGNNPGNASLGGIVMVNAINGVATFSGLSISKAGLDYTLVATASGLSSATSLPFDITPQATAGYKLYLPLVLKP